MQTRLVARAAVLVGACLALFVAAGRSAAATPDSRLLAAYQPVTQFDPLESFRPTRTSSSSWAGDLGARGFRFRARRTSRTRLRRLASQSGLL